MLGGLLEYNSMYFGFRFMYLLALGFYGLAFVHWALTRGRVEAVGRQRDRERVVTPLGVATP
jgi:hypothetical protein